MLLSLERIREKGRQHFDDSLSGGSGAADGLAGDGAEDLWKTLLAVGELAGELTADEGGGETAEGTEGQSEFDCVGDECAIEAVAGLRLDAVAMMEAREGAGDLLVGEVAVPDELGDAGGPSNAFRDPAKWAEGNEDLRTDACGYAREAAGGIGIERFRGRWSEARVFNLGFEFGGHEVGQVGGVGEKGEDQLDGIGHPLAGRKTLGHGVDRTG
jgi:hypothetical protein